MQYERYYKQFYMQYEWYCKQFYIQYERYYKQYLQERRQAIILVFHLHKKKPRQGLSLGGAKKSAASCSPVFLHTVPSAMEGLTSEFGMESKCLSSSITTDIH